MAYRGYLNKLKDLNKNEKFRYFNDNTPLEDYQSSLFSIGFKIKNENPYDLYYQGENPNKALDDLVNLNLLILDCASSLCLLNFMFMKSILGSSKFNKFCKLKLNNYIQFKNFLPFFETQTSKPKSHYKTGDIIYLMADLRAFSFHPSSHTNGHNLIILNTSPEITCRSFRSDDDRIFTIDQCLKNMEKEFYSPLTIKDAYDIFDYAKNYPNCKAPNSPYTNKETFNIFESLHPTKLSEYALQYKKHPETGLTQTNIKIPPSSVYTVSEPLQHSRFDIDKFRKLVTL